jgi:hypothetical protein
MCSSLRLTTPSLKTCFRASPTCQQEKEEGKRPTNVVIMQQHSPCPNLSVRAHADGRHGTLRVLYSTAYLPV